MLSDTRHCLYLTCCQKPIHRVIASTAIQPYMACTLLHARLCVVSLGRVSHWLSGSRLAVAGNMSDNAISSDYPVNSQTRGLTHEESTGDLLLLLLTTNPGPAH